MTGLIFLTFSRSYPDAAALAATNKEIGPKGFVF